MILKPRDYQSYALDAWLQWVKDDKGNPLLLYPVGVGKSVIIALIVSYCIQSHPGTRVQILTHSKELVDQDYLKLKQYWPEAPAGIYCEGLNRKEYWNPITFGTIQSMAHKPELFGHVDLLFIDEADLISPKDESQYRKYIAGLKAVNPNLVVTGLTATGWRHGQGWLWMGENPMFHGSAVDACSIDSYNWFFDEGFLVPPIAKKTKYQYDSKGLHIRAGEYDAKEVDERFNTKELNERCVLLMLEELQTKHAGLVFVNGISQVNAITDIFAAYGESVTYVHSKMSDKERDRNIAAYRDGQYKVMVNNGILTVGFDYSALDYIGMLKLTNRSRLWVQMLGRGTRPYYADGCDLSTREGRLAAIAASHKPYFTVHDFAKNSERLGPINDPFIPMPGQRKRPGEAPVRICDVCGTYNHASAPVCMACGFEFPRRDKFNDETSGKALVKKALPAPTFDKPVEIYDFNVDTATYAVHHKKDKAASLKVTYHCGIRSFSEWIHFEGPMRGKGRTWWMRRTGCTLEEVPATANEAVAQTDGLRIPVKIKVALHDKFPEVKDYEYRDDDEPGESPDTVPGGLYKTGTLANLS